MTPQITPSQKKKNLIKSFLLASEEIIIGIQPPPNIQITILLFFIYVSFPLFFFFFFSPSLRGCLVVCLFYLFYSSMFYNCWEILDQCNLLLPIQYRKQHGLTKILKSFKISIWHVLISLMFLPVQGWGPVILMFSILCHYREFLWTNPLYQGLQTKFQNRRLPGWLTRATAS